jgi:hypothetical protein
MMNFIGNLFSRWPRPLRIFLATVCISLIFVFISELVGKVDCPESNSFANPQCDIGTVIGIATLPLAYLAGFVIFMFYFPIHMLLNFLHIVNNNGEDWSGLSIAIYSAYLSYFLLALIIVCIFTYIIFPRVIKRTSKPKKNRLAKQK